MKKSFDIAKHLPSNMPPNIRALATEFYKSEPKPSDKLELYRFNIVKSPDLKVLWKKFDNLDIDKKELYLFEFLTYAPLFLEEGYKKKITKEEKLKKQRLIKEIKSRTKNLKDTINKVFNLENDSDNESQRAKILEFTTKAEKILLKETEIYKVYTDISAILWGEEFKAITDYSKTASANSEEFLLGKALTVMFRLYFNIGLPNIVSLVIQIMKGVPSNKLVKDGKDRIRKR